MYFLANSSRREWVVFLVLIAFLALPGVLINCLQVSRRSGDRSFLWFAGVLRAVTFLWKVGVTVLQQRVLIAVA